MTPARTEPAAKEPSIAHIAGGTGRVSPLRWAKSRGEILNNRYLILLVASAVGLVGCGPNHAGTRTADAGPDHLGDAHLQRILSWTDAERQVASDAARKLQADLDEAIRAKAPDFRIPPGDYTDWKKPGQSGHLSVLSIMGAENMRIDATGVTFWTSGNTPTQAAVFDGCKNVVVTGLTTDMIQSPFVQGVVSRIIPGGCPPGNDKIIIDLEKGFSKVARGIGRTWQMRRDGRVTAYVEKMALMADATLPSGQGAWLCLGSAAGAVELGDRLSVHDMNGSGGVVVRNCGGMTFTDLTVFSSGSYCVWEAGTRAPGGNTYKRMRIIPRPGSTRIGVGVVDNFHSYNQHQGPTLIDCEIARSLDDGMNIHGFINVVVGVLPDGRHVLASIAGRDYDVGTELILRQAPAMKSLGVAKVTAWESFDQAEGLKLYKTMQQRYKQEFGTPIRDVMEPEFNVVSFDRQTELAVLDMAISQEYVGRGARISNLSIHDGCNRGLKLGAPDSVVEGSRFENIPYGGLALETGLTEFLEGGVPNHVKILNNSFVNCGARTFGHDFADGAIWAVWGSITVSPALPPFYQYAFLHLTPHILYEDIEIRGNRIIDTQGLPIFIANSRGVTVADNEIIRPFQARPEKLRFLNLTRPGVIEGKFAPPVPSELAPVLREPFYGIFISASDEVTLTGNRVKEAPPVFKGLHGEGPWNGTIRAQQ
ncbi:MAG: hypothetical protein RIR25_1776 [Verrucomicrobiota bacterium]